MLPGSSPERVDREAARGKQSGSHAGDPTADRPVAARGHRPAAHARRADHGRLRRAAGRRRHAHRVDLRRLDRAARRVQPPRRARARSRTHPVLAAVRGDLGRRHRRHADARPRVHRGRARRGRHERRDDRRRALRRGAGHGRRASRSRAPSSTRCSSSPRTESPRSSPPSKRWSPSRPAPRAMTLAACRSCSRPATPTRRARSSRSSSTAPTTPLVAWALTIGDVDVRLPARHAGRHRRHRSQRTPALADGARRRGDRHHARGERADQGARARGRARPARDRRRHRARGRRARRRARRVLGALRGRATRRYADNVDKLLRELEASTPTSRTRAVRDRRDRALARRPRDRGARRGRGRDRRSGRAGEQRLRLRPGVRSRRGRRPHVCAR